MDIPYTYTAPIIFTKDRDFQLPLNVKPGQIVYLPADAVLYFPTEVSFVKVEPVDIVGITPASLRGKRKEFEEAIDEHVGGGRQTSKRKCGACGKSGHNARKCPQNGSSEPTNGKQECLTEEQYDAVIDLFKIEQSTKPVAESLDLPLSEVNRACKTGRYDRYVKRWETDDI